MCMATPGSSVETIWQGWKLLPPPLPDLSQPSVQAAAFAVRCACLPCLRRRCACVDPVQERLFEEVNGADGLFWSQGVSVVISTLVDVEHRLLCHMRFPRHNAWTIFSELREKARHDKTCWQDTSREAASCKLSTDVYLQKHGHESWYLEHAMMTCRSSELHLLTSRPTEAKSETTITARRVLEKLQSSVAPSIWEAPSKSASSLHLGHAGTGRYRRPGWP